MSFLKTLFCFLAFLILSTCLTASDFPTEDGQLLLSSETFPLALNTFQNLLVFFYKENDEASDEFYQFFHKLTSSQEGDDEIRFSSIDIEEENELLAVKEYGISGKVPSVILYVRGRPIEYDGGQSLFYMRRWVSKRLSPKSRGIGTVDELDYFLNKFYPNQVKYIFVGANEAPAYYFLDFTIFLKRWEHMPAGHVMPKFGAIYKEIIERYLPQKLDTDPDTDDQSVVLMFRGSQFKSNLTVIYNSSFWNLVEEFEREGIPRVWYYDEYAKEYFFQQNRTFLLVVGQSVQEYQLVLHQVEEKYQGKMQFAIGKYEDNHDMNNIAQALGIENCSEPMVFIINPNGRYQNYDVWIKYKFDEKVQINQENLLEFIQQYFDQKLQKYYKSESLQIEPHLSLTTPLPPHSIRLNSLLFIPFFQYFLPFRSILALFLLDNHCPYSKLLLPIYQQMSKLLHQKLGEQLICIQYNPTVNELAEELAWVELPKGFPAVWMIQQNEVGIEKKEIKHTELNVNNRTALGIFQLVREQIQIKKEVEDEILEEIEKLEKSLKEFEDPLEAKQTINKLSLIHI
eukprot:TRINITY_DN11293_c0_g1_i8.p1 TRINITY_DN11293_c0_g1~~TRINITY_DN11293_c0_g1_i8.p1  ORF type:complete len:569 (+),score=52.83 TRINITY_DN11293_c0_g1_i8:98-1804(+)